jgi:predicted DNA-binding protein (MmcQ/YjbR family)
MTFEKLMQYIHAKKGAWDDFPFDMETLVIKVGPKMFALIGLENDPLRMNLKCDPQHAEGLRAIYPAVQPGYHMHKRHWNTVILDGSIPDDVIYEMIDESYELVFKSLTKQQREELEI